MDAMDVVVKRENDESIVDDEMVGGELFLEEEIKKEPVSYPEGESIPLFSANNNPLDIKSEDVLVEDVQGEEGLESVFFGNNDPLNIKSEDVGTVLENGMSDTRVVTKTKNVHADMVGAIIDASGNIKQENTSWQIEENIRDASGKYICGVCGLTFRKPSNLRDHSVIHKDPSEICMYECKECPFKTRHKSSIKSHHLNRHGDSSQSKKFSCEKCNFQTNYAFSFKKHGVVKHSAVTIVKTGKKTVHKCKDCDYIGKTANRLRRHSVMHREVFMDKCPLCPYQSKHMCGVMNHMLSHKSSSETTMFKCELCSYETKWRHCLRNHLKVHEKKLEQLPIHKCVICEFTTNNIYSLEVHMKKHRAPTEKPDGMVTCYTCGYKSKTKVEMTRHLKYLHKPIWQMELVECFTCGFRTKRKRTLEDHILLLHTPLAKISTESNS